MTARPEWLERAAHEAARAPEDFFMRGRPRGTGRRHSAVLVLVGPGGEGPETRGSDEGASDTGRSKTHEPGAETVVLTERTSALRSHAGQVAFPGGAIDPEDDGPVHAAIREATEEVGLDPTGRDDLDVLGTFPPVFVPASDSSVTPVLAWWPTPRPLAITSPAEVDRILTVPLSVLADPRYRFTVTHPDGRRGPGFEVEEAFVWGFTAHVLDRLLVLGGLARSWDDGVTRLLPPRVSGGRPPTKEPR